jgi:hypothetical protein
METIGGANKKVCVAGADVESFNSNNYVTSKACVLFLN